MRTTTHARGYVMMIVVVMGIVLASLAGILLYATTRDRVENKQQTSSMRAVYAAEAAVSIGVENLRKELEETTSPDLGLVETQTRQNAIEAIPGAAFPTLSVKYYNAVTNTSSTTPTASDLETITSGPNAGLKAQQTPIQVFALAEVDKATASVADAIRIDLIPVFQFGVFFDGDLETYIPATMVLNGRVHANGNIYLSNGGSKVTFQEMLSSAKLIHSYSAHSTSVAVGKNQTVAKKTASSYGSMPTDLPKSTDAAQKAAIEAAFTSTGRVGDRSTGIQPLSVPIKLSSATTCTSTCTDATLSCVKVRATDQNGVCMPKIVSRPDRCSDNSTRAEFPQSLAVELIKRPRPAYGSDAGQPYNKGAETDVYTADFGPRPALTGPRVVSDIFEVEVKKSVPIIRAVEGGDDPGTLVDRMYWKAHIRIIDGVWYKRGSSEPAFDPELVNYTTIKPSASDLNHKFARVLRHSWWWDARERRVYCSQASGKNCAADGAGIYQNGLQIRSSDFDVAAFMDLMSDENARRKFFADGKIPKNGIVLYMTETYDGRYEDANAKYDRSANVRNFLNFPTMHNHLTKSTIETPSGTTPPRVGPVKTANGENPTNPPRPHELGWFPELIWGQHAPVGHRSLTPPMKPNGQTATSEAELIAAYTAPPSAAVPASAECQRSAALTAGSIPATRPTNFSAPDVTPPCIQAGATPLGAENAVRIVRGQTVLAEGFTFVTDNRLYLHGDINVAGKNGAGTVTDATTRQDVAGKIALIADSITIQSEKFDDRSRQDGKFESFFRAPADAKLSTFTSVTPRLTPWSATTTNGDAPNLCTLGKTTPLPTRINASLLMGDVPACIGGGNASGNRSGGINNFPRFVENWIGVSSVINGSIVGLFRAERGNARFIDVDFVGTTWSRRSSAYISGEDGCYYTAPNRTWSFDEALLESIDNLPPGTPRVVGTERLRWVRR